MVEAKEALENSKDSKGMMVMETAEGLIKFIDNHIYEAIDITSIENTCMAEELLKIIFQTIEYFIKPYYEEFKRSSKRK